jgi:hypothetical protein
MAPQGTPGNLNIIVFEKRNRFHFWGEELLQAFLFLHIGMSSDTFIVIFFAQEFFHTFI